MKTLLSLGLMIVSIQSFGQNQPQNPKTSADQKQIQFTQQKQAAPLVNILRHDTVVVHDPQHYNNQDIKIYSSSGRMVKAGKLLNGKKEGTWRAYNENGMISRVEEYHEDVLNGLVLAIDPDGSVIEEDNLTNGIKDGISHQYNRTGTVKIEENYIRGILNGWRRVYSADGKMSEEGFWRNGKRDSVNRWEYPSGKPYVEYNYKNGNINGSSKLFYEDGNMKAAGNYVDGYEEGIWKEFADTTQKVTAEGSYKAGKKTGTWKIFSSTGEPDKTIEYDNNGNVIKETEIKSSKKK